GVLICPILSHFLAESIPAARGDAELSVGNRRNSSTSAIAGSRSAKIHPMPRSAIHLPAPKAVRLLAAPYRPLRLRKANDRFWRKADRQLDRQLRKSCVPRKPGTYDHPSQERPR